MSRRKQGSKPQHRSELSREDEKMEELPVPSRPATAPSPDLLTCGQCGRSFQLCHILDFIEHKRSDCTWPARLRGAPHGGPHSPLAQRGDVQPLGVSDVVGGGAPTGDEVEPVCYICTSCKEPFPSAWLLLQHAQYNHGLHIFLELDHAESPLPPPSSTDNPAGSLSPRSQEGSPSEGPRARETPFRVRSPAAVTGSLLFAPPLHRLPDQSDSGSEETAPSPAQGRRPPVEFSRRLRTLVGGAGPSRRSHQHRLPAVPAGHSSSGTGRQHSPHGRSKDCEFCGKTFKFPSNLVVHRRSHTGEKPYRCPFCEHACSQSSKLKRHMKTHAGLFNGWPPTTGMLGGRAAREQASHRRRYTDERGGQQNPSVTSPLSSQDEFSLKIKEMMVDPDQGEETRPEDATEPSDSEGNGPASDSERLLANGEAEQPAVPGLANGFSYHTKSLLVSPLGSSLLRTAVKSEPGSGPEEAGFNFYSRWLADCAASRQPAALPPPPPPPASSSATTPSPSPAPRASPASENSGGDNNGGSCSSSPPRDVSADSGPGTPKRLGGGGGDEGRRRNACEFCGKVFRNASNLTVHRRSHTGERPYRCELCPYACTQSSKLTRHMKTHVQPGKEVYRCRTCHIPFSIYSTLEKHVKKRHGEQLQDAQPFH
ncbi:zinc finger protein 296 [Mobula hypostoma]|uniref:zinc finger protein 296 n=1 Tax=Mobula hypostoma TaxID=723540 RepID=UPI002FC3D982